MGRIYGIASGKGGVGKTVTSITLAGCLNQMGFNVVLVDGDLQLPNVAETLQLDYDHGLHQVLSRTAELKDTVIQHHEGFDILPGGSTLEGYSEVNLDLMSVVFWMLKDDYEYVVVDTGAGIAYESLLPLMLVDEIILVTTSSPSSVENTSKTKELLELEDVSIRGVVVVDLLGTGDSPDLADSMDTPLLGTIPKDPKISEAAMRGETILSYDPEALSVEAYRSITRSLL